MSLNKEYIEELLCMPYGELIKLVHDLKENLQHACDQLREERKLFNKAHNETKNLSILSGAVMDKMYRCLGNIDSLHTWTQTNLKELDKQVYKDKNRMFTIEARLDKLNEN